MMPLGGETDSLAGGILEDGSTASQPPFSLSSPSDVLERCSAGEYSRPPFTERFVLGGRDLFDGAPVERPCSAMAWVPPRHSKTLMPELLISLLESLRSSSVRWRREQVAEHRRKVCTRGRSVEQLHRRQHALTSLGIADGSRR